MTNSRHPILISDGDKSEQATLHGLMTRSHKVYRPNRIWWRIKDDAVITVARYGA